MTSTVTLQAYVAAATTYANNEATALDAYTAEMAQLHAKGWSNFEESDWDRLILVMGYATSSVLTLRSKIQELKRNQKLLEAAQAA